MKAVLALAMGAAALAPSQPKVRDRAAYRLRYLQMTQKQKAADEAARRRPEAALSRRDGSLALPRAARSTNGTRFEGSHPRAPKSSPTPDALHRTQITPRQLDRALRRSHTPHGAALSSRWLRKRGRGTGSDADELRPKIRRWPPAKTTRELPPPLPRPRAPKTHENNP